MLKCLRIILIILSYLLITARKYPSSTSSSTNANTCGIYDVVFDVSPPAKGRFQTPISISEDRLQINEDQPFIRLTEYGSSGYCMTDDFL
ncbi:hypothetical protein DICVIV_04675 [Dictyocaulus viviparus]|uniref:Transthyretin-like family protein n=1 Tax=Dictyocaulus viviparus TaxID=29172 RepID=A0A0D8XZK7_DICVI|nr:hypothetical protein DICVIV_04675 [Dictyocaulus viviparus]